MGLAPPTIKSRSSSACLILELKSVEEIAPIHKAQLLTYMKLSGIHTGLLINFNVRRLIDGIERFKL